MTPFSVIRSINHPPIWLCDGFFVVNACKFHRYHNIVKAFLIVFFVLIKAVLHVWLYKHKLNVQFRVTSLCVSDCRCTFSVKFAHPTGVEDKGIIGFDDIFDGDLNLLINARGINLPMPSKRARFHKSILKYSICCRISV